MNEIRDLLRQLFTTEEAIDEWLDTPDKTLGGRTPRETLVIDEKRVLNLINAMIHGVPL